MEPFENYIGKMSSKISIELYQANIGLVCIPMLTGFLFLKIIQLQFINHELNAHNICFGFKMSYIYLFIGKIKKNLKAANNIILFKISMVHSQSSKM